MREAAAVIPARGHRSWALAISALLLAPVVHAQSTPAPTLKSHVVHILTPDQRLIGAGTSISFSGLILTAKHILEDSSVAGSRAPNYLLRVLIGRPHDSALDHARILAVHPFLDLAILQHESERPIPPIEVGTVNGLKTQDEVLVIGHDIDATELYREKGGKIDEVARKGRLVISRSAPPGTSGGPVIKDEKLIAVIESTTIDQVTAVPFSQEARDYFELVGITMADGFASRSDTIAKLASKARLYEQLLLDVQQDVAWFADVKSTPAELSIQLRYDKRLSIQPDFWVQMEIFVYPKFVSSKPELTTLEAKLKLHDSGVLKSRHATYTVDDIVASLIGKLQELAVRTGQNRPAPVLQTSDILGFDVAAWVNMIAKAPTVTQEVNREMLNFIGTPKPRLVCFSIHRKSSGREFASLPSIGNGPCPEPLVFAHGQP